MAAAQRGDDPAVLSSALDGQTTAELRHLHAAAAAEIIAERLGLSENFTGQSARLVLERIDALYMACEVSFLMGDFEGTLSRGLELHQLAQPRGIFYGGFTHLAPANFFLGNFNECLEQASGVYWEVTHRRDVGAAMLVRAFASAGGVCGYRGDEKSAARWFARAQQVAGGENCSWKCDFTLLMQADVHLHHGRREEGGPVAGRASTPVERGSGEGGTPPSGQRRWAAEPLTRPRSSWKAVPIRAPCWPGHAGK